MTIPVILASAIKLGVIATELTVDFDEIGTGQKKPIEFIKKVTSERKLLCSVDNPDKCVLL